ncbi:MULTISPECIES: Flp pilus assembly protein CpaB [Acidiphilium]|jgi:pilus assembly protein CpaB|uniref:SAF domain protein n=6 Tax=Acidiphilium TaxID=522 RepID=A5G038_ACICJ|nr:MULTISPECIES: Flp pilus assembly protein CpaB [Acidiphilium]ABQ31220.1 SAF domain protein [Acidiphilium cryptum JF-5]KDM66878.1 putative pilus assembly protein [Acidiphilium sp. JA12-A1]MBS3023805.1 Flp pilus assembly protein CpaB [Acidiphilium multivorum]BAJ81612.1 putative pilus assembly protein [Acidiphilium multivorum AIU301]GAN74141.1 pilus assembly protein [Acidiphilium multivorum AIU301]
MLLRIALFILLALGLAGFGTVAWLDMHPSHPHAKAPKMVALLATGRPLAPGTLLQPADFVAENRPPSKVPADAVPDTPANRAAYTGAMVRHRLSAGDLLATDIVIRPGDHGFLAAVLQPGMRAVSVGVDAITGAAGLIWPGDHVDLLLTQHLTGANLLPTQRVAAETVLSDVRVIAIDQRLVQGASGTHPAAKNTARTVTLEVTPEQAERVEVAAHLGPLSLIVRPSEAARGPTPKPPPVFSGQVSPALAALNVPGQTGITVFQGDKGTTEYHPQ